MMKRPLMFGVGVLGFGAWVGAAGPATAATRPAVALAWQRLPDLPDPLGVAGAFVGESGGAVLVAGGANFPGGVPWRGGRKVCSGAVHVLVEGSAGTAVPTGGAGPLRWVANAGALPRALSYGVSVTTDRGVLIIGGCDASQCYADVYRAEWTPDHGVRTTVLPSLPRPLAFMAGALVGRTVFVAGGQETVASPRATRSVYSLDLAAEGTADFAWREEPSWPGPARVLAVGAGQAGEGGPAFYLFSGRDVQPGQLPRTLSDAYRFEPKTRHWVTLGPVRDGDRETCVMAGTAVPHGDHTILLLGGDSGELFTPIEQRRAEIAATADPDARRAAEAGLNETLDKHPGFAGTVIAYDTVAGTYETVGRLPRPAPVTATAIPWRRGILLPTGEVRPGVRSPAVWHGTPLPPGTGNASAGRTE
jgi:N-acetylneuraminic acid mutarotase